jgi:hypothetical protein
LIGELCHSLLESSDNGPNQLDNGHQETAVGAGSQVIPRGGTDGLDDGTAADLAIDGKVPSGHGHADNHVSQRGNKAGCPKEAKQKVPAAVFGKVVVGIDTNGDFQVAGGNGIGGNLNAAQ